MLAAVKQNSRTLDYASEALQQDKELLKIAGIKSMPINYSVDIRGASGSQRAQKISKATYEYFCENNELYL